MGNKLVRALIAFFILNTAIFLMAAIALVAVDHYLPENGWLPLLIVFASLFSMVTSFNDTLSGQIKNWVKGEHNSSGGPK